jgi:hypothetical protein
VRKLECDKKDIDTFSLEKEIVSEKGNFEIIKKNTGFWWHDQRLGKWLLKVRPRNLCDNCVIELNKVPPPYPKINDVLFFDELELLINAYFECEIKNDLYKYDHPLKSGKYLTCMIYLERMKKKLKEIEDKIPQELKL